jgi:NTP pyrophosphatase (non-canonical NTP hydrolase)
MTRKDRQLAGFAWAVENFGVEEVSSFPQRGLRLLEEAAETAQATGLSEELAHKIVTHVWSRPVGELPQELGGLSLTMLILAELAELDLDAAEEHELQRVLRKPKHHWVTRNKAKNDAGLIADGVLALLDQPPTYQDGVPCPHPGCLNHISHPCEGCGRIAGRSKIPTSHP